MWKVSPYTCQLNNGVAIYGCELLNDHIDDTNIAFVADKEKESFFDSDYVLIEKNTVSRWIRDFPKINGRTRDDANNNFESRVKRMLLSDASIKEHFYKYNNGKKSKLQLCLKVLELNIKEFLGSL